MQRPPRDPVQILMGIVIEPRARKYGHGVYTMRYCLLGLIIVMVLAISHHSFAWGNGQRTYIPKERPRNTSANHPRIPTELKTPQLKSTHRKISSRLAHMISENASQVARRGRHRFTDTDSEVSPIEEARVVFHMIDARDRDLEMMRAYGAKILSVRNQLVAVEVSINQVENIVTHVEAIKYARLPHRTFPMDVMSEGVNLTGADSVHSAGFTGNGVKIVVLDVGFKGLAEAQTNGDIPGDVITHDYSGKGLQTQYRHGTACAEIVHDMAPDAELHLLKVYDEIDLYDSLEYCIQNGIDIVSASVVFFGSGPGDGTGPICELADEVRENGILVVVAAGNSANSSVEGMPYGMHWQGPFYDSDSDDLHEFIKGDANSWYNTIVAVPYQDDDGNPETDDLSVVMRWNDWPDADVDYDLFLFDFYDMTLIDYSNYLQDGDGPPLEGIVIDIPDEEDYPHYYALVVSKDSGEPSGVDIELSLGGSSAFIPFYPYNSPISTSPSSIYEPADAVSVMAVGAINYDSWITGPQEDFSSQGPTNAWAGSSGRIKPDISGPDGVSGHAYGPSQFYGTSAATPHVSGAAALILSMHPHLTVDELQAVLESMALDMGPEGKDNLYGWGRLNVYPYNNPPVLDVMENMTVDTGQALTFSISGSDPDRDELTYAVTDLPAGANFNLDTQTFDWIPGSNQTGTYDVGFEVSDGSDASSRVVTIVVNQASVSPVAGDIDGNGKIDLVDVILALQTASGSNPGVMINTQSDVDGDGKIGMAEVIYLLQIVSGLISAN